MPKACCEQLSLFTIDTPDEVFAISRMTGSDDFFGIPLLAVRPDPWVLNIIPNAEYTISFAGAIAALCPTKTKWNDVEPGYEYMHFLINEQMYEVTFVCPSEKYKELIENNMEEECIENE